MFRDLGFQGVGIWVYRVSGFIGFGGLEFGAGTHLGFSFWGFRGLGAWGCRSLGF